MKFTKKELKKIILEEYQKVLKEYISEATPSYHPSEEEEGERQEEIKNEKLANDLVKAIKANPASKWLLSADEGRVNAALMALAKKLTGQQGASAGDGGKYLSDLFEDAAQFAQQQNKAGKGPKPTPDPFALTTIDNIRELLNNLVTTLGAASVEEGATMDEGSLNLETLPGAESKDPRVVELRDVIFKLDDLQFDSLEVDPGRGDGSSSGDAQSWVGDAVGNLVQAIEALLYQKVVGNVEED